jgi:hypothetical protein
MVKLSRSILTLSDFAFFAVTFGVNLAAGFAGAVGFEATGLGALGLVIDLVVAGLEAIVLLTTGFLTTAFFTSGFIATGFLAAGFFATALVAEGLTELEVATVVDLISAISFSK